MEKQVMLSNGGNDIEIKKNGYLTCMSAMKARAMCIFDELSVVHTRGALLEETHYYPFGLVMTGISSKALKYGDPENKKKFNRIEHTTDFELNRYDAFYRSLDPQIGRWGTIDPKPNEFNGLYNAKGNNPILRADPLGDTAIYYRYAGKEIYRINDGSKRITPTVISTKHEKSFNEAIADGKATIDDLKGFGITYDTKAFSKFYADNKNKFKANTVGGNSIEIADQVSVDGKSRQK